MKRLLRVAGVLLVTLLALFVVVQALRVPLLTDPSPWLRSGGVTAALVGVGLLTADVVLPVPSSFVMVANGALFGVVPGMLLSLVGSLGATLLGFALGRAGSPLLLGRISPAERDRADRLLRRWGVLAVALTRPLPLVAETVAILAGASSLRWRWVAAAAVAGSLPPALLYALTGSVATRPGSALLMFGLVLLLTALLALAGRHLGMHEPPSRPL